MGVAGSGKTTIANALAERLGVPFVEGDSLHPAANVKKMASGIPLTDEDRWPWLRAIGERMEVERVHRPWRGGVLFRPQACLSRLPAQGSAWPGAVHPAGWIARADRPRMSKRKGHFMPPALLDSQFATLERPTADEHATVLDISHTIPSLVTEAVQAVTAEAVAT